MLDLTCRSSHEEDSDNSSVEELTQAASVSSSYSGGNESDTLSPTLSEVDLKEFAHVQGWESLKQSLSRLDSDNTDNIRQSQNSRTGFLAKLLMFLILPLAVTTLVTNPALNFDGEESIYVPGVGFSGFWFTLGRLKSIENPASKNYVCFSAGCLGAVTILNNFTVDEMACMASSAQSAWRKGEITRYDVISEFVDGVVYRRFPRKPICVTSSENMKDNDELGDVPINNPDLLSRLHILTSTKTSLLGMKAVMRSPTDVNELREMLIQTTWM